jgi:crotonobetainyl-CoA:carnitine CoA-transferase CaiB-like acyl-CoA transferase
MVSGPMCGRLFADMSAEVIKVEPPGAGDAMRALPPFSGVLTSKSNYSPIRRLFIESTFYFVAFHKIWE